MKTIAYLTVTGLALVQGAHIRGDANTDNTYMTEGGADTTGGTTTYMTEGGAIDASGASDATIPNPRDTGMPATAVNPDCVWSNIVTHCNKKTNKANKKACKKNRGKNCKNTGSPIK